MLRVYSRHALDLFADTPVLDDLFALRRSADHLRAPTVTGAQHIPVHGVGQLTHPRVTRVNRRLRHVDLRSRSPLVARMWITPGRLREKESQKKVFRCFSSKLSV